MFTNTDKANQWFDLQKNAPAKIQGQFKLVGNVEPDDVIYEFHGTCGKGTTGDFCYRILCGLLINMVVRSAVQPRYDSLLYANSSCV